MYFIDFNLMEYRNYLRKFNSGKLQNVFQFKKYMYEKHKQVKNINDNGK